MIFWGSHTHTHLKKPVLVGNYWSRWCLGTVDFWGWIILWVRAILGTVGG